MTTSANGTPRKPSASSNSTGHSPLSSPTAHGQRKLTPAANMLTVGMSASGLKPLNNGWPVWSNGSNSKRTASLSSATSMTETHTPGNDSFRSSVGETWSSSRSPAPWDMTGSPGGPVEIGASPSKKEYIQMDAHHPYLLQQARQRQATAAQAAAFSGSRVVGLGQEDEKRILDEAERQPKSSFSPQRFDSAAVKTSPFVAQPNGLPTHVNSVPTLGHTPTTHGDEFSLGLRNLSIQDHEQYGTMHNQYRPQQPVHSVPPMHGMPMPQIRPMAPMQPPPPRTSYSIYAQNEYPNYYPPPPLASREPFPPVEYPYGYDSYRSTPDPTPIYIPTAPPSAQPAPGMYGAARPSGFYPPQPVLFPPPPLHNHLSTPQLTAMPTIQDKEPYTTIPHQGLILTSMRHSTPSPHPYPPPTGQLPVIIGVGASVYGHAPPNTHPMHIYPGLRSNRRLDQVDTSATLRSALLDEFRTNKTRKWELREIFGHVVEFSGDQHGSRFIQQKLETATPEEKQAIFAEIVPTHALQLIQDVFGNYVIQKLLEHGTPRQKLQLASTMEGHILTLSLQMYGCRVVQKAVEHVPPEQQTAFVKELETHVLRCVKDANGNHVIQKLIERVAFDLLGFISAFRGHVFELASHPYGCRVLQRCFEHLNEEQSRPLLDELHKFGSSLMQDQFGNYVIQFVLEHGRPEDRLMIISKLRGHFLTMAKHKFASNVCEKALIVAEPETRRVLIEEILTPKSDGVSPIVIMMKDQFANYVLQRCLTVVEGDQKDVLAEMVRAQLASMRKYANTYSKHLVSIERLLEKYVPSKTAGTVEDQENA